MKFIDIEEHRSSIDGLISSFSDLGPEDMPCLPGRMNDYVAREKIDVASMIQSLPLSPNKSAFDDIFATPFELGDDVDTTPIVQPLFNASMPMKKGTQARIHDKVQLGFLSLVAMFIYLSTKDEWSTKRVVPAFSAKQSFSSLTNDFNIVHAIEANTFRVIVYNPLVIAAPRKKSRTSSSSSSVPAKAKAVVTKTSQPFEVRPLRKRTNKITRLEEEQYKAHEEREKKRKQKEEAKKKDKKTKESSDEESESSEEDQVLTNKERKKGKNSKSSKNSNLGFSPPPPRVDPADKSISSVLMKQMQDLRDSMAEEKRLRIERESEIRVLRIERDSEIRVLNCKIDHKIELAKELVTQRGQLDKEWKSWAEHGADMRGGGMRDLATIMRENRTAELQAQKIRSSSEFAITATAVDVVPHNSSYAAMNGGAGGGAGGPSIQPIGPAVSMLPPSATSIPHYGLGDGDGDGVANNLMGLIQVATHAKVRKRREEEEQKQKEEEKKKAQEEMERKRRNQKQTQLIQAIMLATQSDMDLDITEILKMLPQ